MTTPTTVPAHARAETRAHTVPRRLQSPRARAATGRSRGRGQAAGFALALTAAIGLLLALPTPRALAQPASVGYLESTAYPIRVHYPTVGHAAVAQTVLDEAERTWEVEVEQMGFDPPMTEDASGTQMPGLWIYLVAGADYAHAEPISGIDETPFTDCTTRVLLPADLPAEYLPSYVAHESHHAMEMAVDCTEASFAYENTTVAVTTLQFPGDALWRGYFLPTFQAFPHLGVDCTFFFDQSKRYYHYGASLFQLFLEAWLGQGDGRLLPRFWRAARTTGTVTVGGGQAMASVPNEPDLLDGVAAVLAEEGSSLDEAFAEFAIWRLFVGVDDDGAHFPDGDLWVGSELDLTERLAAADLPFAGAEPPELPMDYGTIYLELDLAGIAPPMGVVFSMEGSAAARWHVDALRFGADGTVTVDPVEVDETGLAESSRGGLGDAERIVFAISALGTEEHDADRPSCTTGHELTYGLRLTDTDTAPVIEGVTPAELEPGQSALLVVTGQGFLEGVTAEVQGDGVTVFSTQRVDAATAHVTVTVQATASLGPRDLVLTNPNGHSGRRDAAFAVIAVPTDAGGCGCASGGPSSGGAPLTLLLGVLLVGLALIARGRRARRAPSGSDPRPPR